MKACVAAVSAMANCTAMVSRDLGKAQEAGHLVVVALALVLALTACSDGHLQTGDGTWCITQSGDRYLCPGATPPTVEADPHIPDLWRCLPGAEGPTPWWCEEDIDGRADSLDDIPVGRAQPGEKWLIEDEDQIYIFDAPS